MTSTLTLQQLSIGYHLKRNRLRVIVPAMNISLQANELTCLIGPNGVGKSTLLKTIAGFLPPLDGTILLHNKKLSDYSPQEMAKEISVVLTSKVDTELTVFDIVGMGRAPYTGFWGTLSAEDKQMVSDAILSTGISHLAKRNILELSDGERQKVMIAKALAQQTNLIILDEPTAFLDYPSKVETLQMLRHLAHEQHKSILLSTHDVELALQLSDHLWLMEENKLSIGTPRELADDDTLSHFIERKGIHFDKEKLRIVIDG